MKTQQQRSEERRQEKLDLIREQIEAGTLVVRKMTRAERAKFPPKSAPKRSRTGKSA
jgi:anti-sigma28 factor (negative regulator of flagellin synthesis)